MSELWDIQRLNTYIGAQIQRICEESTMSEDAHTSGDFTPRDQQNDKNPVYRVIYPVQGNENTDSQFAASCQLGDDGNIIFIPLTMVIVSDDHSAHRASYDEVREILCNEHRWDTSTPEWAAHNVPILSYEDTVLLREFQRFKS